MYSALSNRERVEELSAFCDRENTLAQSDSAPQLSFSSRQEESRQESNLTSLEITTPSICNDNEADKTTTTIITTVTAEKGEPVMEQLINNLKIDFEEVGCIPTNGAPTGIQYTADSSHLDAPSEFSNADNLEYQKAEMLRLENKILQLQEMNLTSAENLDVCRSELSSSLANAEKLQHDLSDVLEIMNKLSIHCKTGNIADLGIMAFESQQPSSPVVSMGDIYDENSFCEGVNPLRSANYHQNNIPGSLLVDTTTDLSMSMISISEANHSSNDQQVVDHIKASISNFYSGNIEALEGVQSEIAKLKSKLSVMENELMLANQSKLALITEIEELKSEKVIPKTESSLVIDGTPMSKTHMTTSPNTSVSSVECEKLKTDLIKVREALVQSEQELMIQQMTSESLQNKLDSFSLSNDKDVSQSQYQSEKILAVTRAGHPDETQSSPSEANSSRSFSPIQSISFSESPVLSSATSAAPQTSGKHEEEKAAIRKELVLVLGEVEKLSLDVDVLKIDVDALTDVVAAREADLLVATNTIDDLKRIIFNLEDSVRQSMLGKSEISELHAQILVLEQANTDLASTVKSAESTSERHLSQLEKLLKANSDLTSNLKACLEESDHLKLQFGFLEELLESNEIQSQEAVAFAKEAAMKLEIAETQIACFKMSSKLLSPKNQHRLLVNHKKDQTNASRITNGGSNSITSSIANQDEEVKMLTEQLKAANTMVSQQEKEIISCNQTISELELQLVLLGEDSRTPVDVNSPQKVSGLVATNSAALGVQSSPGLPARSRPEPSVPSGKASRIIPKEDGSDSASVSTTSAVSPERLISSELISMPVADLAIDCKGASEGLDSVLEMNRESISALDRRVHELEDELQEKSHLTGDLVVKLKQSQLSADALLQTSIVFESKLKKMSHFSEAERVFLRTIFMESREILDTIEAVLQTDIKHMTTYVDHLRGILDPRGEYFQLKYEGLLNEVITMLEALETTKTKIIHYGKYIEDKMLATSAAPLSPS